MTDSTKFLAIDLGASSGRAVVGTLHHHRLDLQEVHRFANRPVHILGRMYWDLLALFEEIKTGIRRAAELGPITSIGIDTWGVDYGLLNDHGELVGPVYHYRDSRTAGVLDKLLVHSTREEIYHTTGLQFMPLNTLCQLLVAKEADPEQFKHASQLLFIPDLLNYWLTGVRRNEYTIASTSQMLAVRARDWAKDLLQQLGLPTPLFESIINPGSLLGPLHTSITHELNVPACDVVATAAHDTASAVAAVPAVSPDHWAYISSGTWSLVGIETLHPVTSAAALESNFTNEGGIDGTIRLLKNVAGLWLLQESARVWAEAGTPYEFSALTQAAELAEPRRSLIDPDDARFASHGDMPSRIAERCYETGQPVPETPGQFARCIFESLAFKYRVHIERLEEITGQQIERIHIVGGGSRNHLLCQLTADITGRPVVAGPAEATAAGNIMVQALGRGLVRSRAEIRRVIAASSVLASYTPNDTTSWAHTYDDFRAVICSSEMR